MATESNKNYWTGVNRPQSFQRSSTPSTSQPTSYKTPDQVLYEKAKEQSEKVKELVKKQSKRRKSKKKVIKTQEELDNSINYLQSNQVLQTVKVEPEKTSFVESSESKPDNYREFVKRQEEQEKKFDNYAVYDVDKGISRAPTFRDEMSVINIKQAESQPTSNLYTPKTRTTKIFYNPITYEQLGTEQERLITQPKPLLTEGTKPSKIESFIQRQRNIRAGEQTFKQQIVNTLSAPAEVIRTGQKVSTIADKQLKTFAGSLVRGTGKILSYGAETFREVPGALLTPRKFTLSTLRGQQYTIPESTKQSLIKTRELKQDPDVQAVGLTAGFIALPALGVVGKTASLGVEGYLAYRGAKTFISNPNIETLAQGTLMSVPLFFRFTRSLKTQNLESPLIQLKKQQMLESVKIPTTGKPFSSTTTQTFVPFKKTLDTVKGTEFRYTETISVTKKPAGFDVPTLLSPAKGQFKGTSYVLPGAEVVVRPTQRQLQLIPKNYDPFTPIRQQEFSISNIGIRKPTFYEKALTDPKQLRFNLEYKPVPQRATRLLEAYQRPSPIQGIQTTLNPNTIYKPPVAQTYSIRVPIIKRPSLSMTRSKRASLSGPKIQFSEYQFSESASRNIATITRLPSKISDSIIKTGKIPTGIKTIPIGPKLMGITALSSRQDIITSSILDSKLATRPALSLELKGILTPIGKTATQSKLLLKPITGQILEPIQVSTLKQETTQIYDDGGGYIRTPPKPIKYIPPRTPPLVVPKPIPIFLFRDKRNYKQLKPETGYDVYYYQGKRRIKANFSPLGKENALSTLAQTLDKNTAYRGSIKATSSKIVKGPVHPYYTQNKSKFTKQGKTLTEKKKYRKDYPFE